MFVIDYDPIVLGPPRIIGPFDTKEDADQWGLRHIHNGLWHSMALTAVSSAATALSASDRPVMDAVTHA